MNAKDLQAVIDECCNAVTFVYNGQNCGVECVTITDGIPEFDVWYGDKVVTCNDIGTVMKEAFFEGKSLAEISDGLDIWFS